MKTHNMDDFGEEEFNLLKQVFDDREETED